MDSSSREVRLNDETDYGLCFACGPRNRSGLRLRFERDGAGVTTTFVPRLSHQGYPGYVHGGVATALLDEIMSRVFLLDGQWVMTARVDVRFRHPIPLGQRIRGAAERSRALRGFLQAQGRLELADGRVAADAVGTFVPVPDDTLASMTGSYPRLAREWMKPG